MFFNTYTTIHSLLSLIAIFTGLLVLVDLLVARLPNIVTAVFLLTAVLTSATGFGFTFRGLLPSHIVGAIALVVLAIALVARYVGHRSGAWRWIYAATMVASVYFLVFVGIAQAFAKFGPLHALSPTQSEPPFFIVQAVVLVIFVALGFAAARVYRPSITTMMQPGQFAR